MPRYKFSSHSTCLNGNAPRDMFGHVLAMLRFDYLLDCIRIGQSRRPTDYKCSLSRQCSQHWHFTPTCLKTRQAALKCLHASDWHSLHTIKLPTHTNQRLFPSGISKRTAQTSQGSLTIISSTMDLTFSAQFALPCAFYVDSFVPVRKIIFNRWQEQSWP